MFFYVKFSLIVLGGMLIGVPAAGVLVRRVLLPFFIWVENFPV